MTLCHPRKGIHHGPLKRHKHRVGPNLALMSSTRNLNHFTRSGSSNSNVLSDHGHPPLRPPPLRAVNHSILINPDVQYSSRPPRCSAALFPLLREKTQCYINIFEQDGGTCPRQKMLNLEMHLQFVTQFQDASPDASLVTYYRASYGIGFGMIG